jgi:5-methylcytosine-specific restriction endonuclease McrA
VEEREKKHSKRMSGSRNPQYGKTGDKGAFFGKHHSPETKEKMSIAKKGKPRPDLSKRMQGQGNPNYGKKFTAEMRKSISERTTGFNNPMYGKKRPELSEKMKGANNCNWQGGKSFEPYTINWTETLRRSIRERDKYMCQLCRKLQGDKAFDVHHIDYCKENCNPENLITLCKKCHRETNNNREYWEMFFNYRKDLCE